MYRDKTWIGVHFIMSFIDYLKDHFLMISLYLLVNIFVLFALIVFKVNPFLIYYIPTIISMLGLTILFSDYLRRRKFYNLLISINNRVNKKYFIHEIVDKPTFIDGKILYNVISDANRDMIETINEYKFRENDFKEYVEMWIHEVKTPLASTKLIIENNKDKVSKNINEELDRIDAYLDQIFYYVRSEYVENDYLIKKVNLKDLINDVVAKNKKLFINKKINIELSDLNIDVNTDSKWLVFIIDQIIQNSIKYIDCNGTINIFGRKNKDSFYLTIKDNGIGIDKSDLSRVFERGFTGKNGRNKYNSTGIGLYLCKKLCTSLGHNIFIDSKLGSGTEVTIVFPSDSYIDI